MRTLPPILDRSGRIIFLRLVLNGVLQSVMVVGTMLLVRHAFDTLLARPPRPSTALFGLQGTRAVLFFAASLLMCTGLAAVLRMVELTDAERLGQGYIHRVRMTLFDQMAKFPPRAIGRRGAGVIMLRFVGDLSALRIWVSRGLVRIVVALIVVVLATGALATIDAPLAAASVAIMLLGLAGNLLLGPLMENAVNESRLLRGRLARNINEKIRAFSVILALNQFRRERRKFRNQSSLLRGAMIARARIAGLMRIVTDGSAVISMSLLLAIGAFEVARDMTTSGSVAGAMAIVGFISNAFKDFGRVHEYLQNARVSERKLLEFLQTRTMRGRAENLPVLAVGSGTVVFENVCLEGCLEDVSATAPGGGRVVLSGPNGAGKSTLVQAAARLIDLTSGRILVDGQDLAQCNLSSVREAIGIVSPDLPLLRGTVGFNLRYRKPGASQEELARAARICGLDEMLETLPGGLRFRLQEGGVNLSLGQRHRLALARAILGSPPILLIDEIDANLDRQADEAITRILADYPGTVIMVTRSQSRIDQADLCWHLEGGRLVRIDTRPEAEANFSGTEHRT